MRPLFVAYRALRAPNSKRIVLDHPFTTAGSPIFFHTPSAPDPDDSNRLHLEAGAALCAADRPLRSGDRVLSTHWFEHHDLSERELRFLVLLARQAADLIEYWQSHALGQSAERMRGAISVEAVGTVFLNVQGRVNAANDTS